MSNIIYTILIGALTGLLLGPIVIPILKILKAGQNIRDDGPRSHLKKIGTPTMGGIIIILSLITATLFMNKSFNGIYAVTMVTTLGCGLIGLLDDSIKIIKKRSLGLRAYQKLIGQFIFALILSYYAYLNIGSRLFIPFTKNTIDLGFLYIPFITLIIVFIINSVNLTDGLDGLASSVTIVIFSFFTYVCYALKMNEFTIFSAAIVGSCLGFLRYNSHQAQVFMGDTGSLALGGAVAALFVLTGFTLYLPIIGIIYVAEGASVLLQIACFKLTGKRIFKMAPLHHHFELSGWHESKVVAVFGIISAISCLIGFLTLL